MEISLVDVAWQHRQVRAEIDRALDQLLTDVECDGGAFVAALEYATETEATVLGKPSADYFAAALSALDAEPELTWLVTDDIDADVHGAQLFGMKTVLLRTGKFRPDDLDYSSVIPDVVLSSIAQFPDWIDRVW